MIVHLYNVQPEQRLFFPVSHFSFESHLRVKVFPRTAATIYWKDPSIGSNMGVSLRKAANLSDIQTYFTAFLGSDFCGAMDKLIKLSLVVYLRYTYHGPKYGLTYLARTFLSYLSKKIQILSYTFCYISPIFLDFFLRGEKSII